MKFTAVIIEDELPARATIRSYVKKYAPEVVIAEEFDSVQSGMNYLKSNSPDIVFLDVQLSDGLGIDILNKIDTSKLRIIFTTAHEQYAMQAFKNKAFGYLLKPLNPLDFKEIIRRVIIDALNTKTNRTIKLPISDGEIWIKLSDIVRCQSFSNYTRIFCTQKSYTISKTLKYVETELLNSDQFVRVHQSHLINIDFVAEKEIKKQCVLLSNGDLIPVSRSRKLDLIDRF